MTRIRPLTVDEAPVAARPLLKPLADDQGRAPGSAGIQAYCPPVLAASRALAAAPGESGVLPGELISLVCLRVAQLVTCPL
jgi:hypothetical protein